jgi:hypothetical protein
VTPEDEPVTDRNLFLRYRLVVVWVGLVLSWVGILGFLRRTTTDERSVAPGASEKIVILIAMTILLTIAPWPRALLGEIGDAYIGIWTVVVIGSLIAVQDIRGGCRSR